MMNIDELRAELNTQIALVEKCMVAMNENADRGQKAEAERDQLRAELGQYPEIQAMLMAENKELRAEVGRLKSQEPVAYEFRMRADWVPDWGLWSPCNKEQHEMYIRAPKLHDWVYETRALFLATGAAPNECGNTPYDEGPFTIVEEQAAPTKEQT